MLKQHRMLFISLLIIFSIVALFAYIKRPQPIAVVVHKVKQGEVLSTSAMIQTCCASAIDA